jgi:hypothetical protein
LWGSLSSCAPVGNRRYGRVANPPQDSILPHMKSTSSLGQRSRSIRLVRLIYWCENIMQPFDFGGLTSQENTISVPIQTDKDGYLGRECPNPDCEEYFKITPGTGIKGPAG